MFYHLYSIAHVLAIVPLFFIDVFLFPTWLVSAEANRPNIILFYSTITVTQTWESAR